MSALSKTLGALLLSILVVGDLAADEMQIAVSVRYSQIKGTSHAHIYLYSGDGKLIRQLTADETVQDTISSGNFSWGFCFQIGQAASYDFS